MPAVMWFRRDLRLGDNPALLEACADGAVLPLFVLDPALWEPAGPARRAYLAASLRSLAGDLPLAVVSGDPVRRVVQAATEVGAERVHVAADFGPYGHARDLAVEQALADAGVELVRTGSPYAMAPDRVTSGGGTPYRVFTPFSKAWADLEAWRQGRTGFPVVDAGMRQLRTTGWMHNRVRMIVASFLVKDLHVEWQHGARHFMRWLVDGDLASNQHGWQWVAGSGTDASPYFRVFNPTTQGRKFDPDATYVRQWVPELADLPVGDDPHDPSPADRDEVGYPQPIVDHAAERREALARYEEIT